MPRLVAVGHPEDAALEAYRDIRERDLVGRDRRFIAEGEVVLRQLVECGRFAVESCLIAERQYEKLVPLLARLPEETPVFLASPAVIETVAGFPVHRGILAVGIRPPDEPLHRFVDRLPDEALVVVCIATANHDNLGGILRNAAAFAADAVLIDDTSCDPLYRKAIRVSVGAALRVPWHRGGSAEAVLDALAGRGFSLHALSPAAPQALAAVRIGLPAALVFGAEGPGLPPAILARCRPLGIPMAAGFDSLNLATTSGIVLHHARFFS